MSHINIIHQVVIAQWLARRLATSEVSGSNPSKGDYVLVKLMAYFLYLRNVKIQRTFKRIHVLPSRADVSKNMIRSYFCVGNGLA